MRVVDLGTIKLIYHVLAFAMDEKDWSRWFVSTPGRFPRRERKRKFFCKAKPGGWREHWPWSRQRWYSVRPSTPQGALPQRGPVKFREAGPSVDIPMLGADLGFEEQPFEKPSPGMTYLEILKSVVGNPRWHERRRGSREVP
jgi:hypothetical protein